MTAVRCYNERQEIYIFIRKRGYIMSALVAFVNSFLSYLLLMAVIVVVAGVGIFIGITMRRKKNLKER